MLKIDRRARIETVGAKVRWLRLPGADVTFTFWQRRVNVFVFVHDGQPLIDPGPEKPGPYDIFVQQADP